MGEWGTTAVRGWRKAAARVSCAALLLLPTPLFAQETAPGSRTEELEKAQAEKATELRPYVPGRAESYLNRAEELLARGSAFHPFFDSAYSGGGFTLGAGYMTHVGAYNTLDLRGSLTPSGYKRFEGELFMPRLLDRRATLSIVGGWREATQVGYYGPGTANSKDDRANYGFEQPYGVATFQLRPVRRVLVVGAGFEASEWEQTPGTGGEPSVETVYTPATLPGLGAKVTYLHSQLMAGIDTRSSPGYTRRGGFYGVTVHDFADPDSAYGFRQWEYEAIQHIPVLRETWVLSLHGRVATTGTKDDQTIPFFMLPALGGGSSLRGYSSWRFRDRNSLLMQAEWRVVVNRFVDVALFYDAGKVTAHSRDLNFERLKNDVGAGVRFHGPLTTPLRVELAKGNEGLSFIFSGQASF